MRQYNGLTATRFQSVSVRTNPIDGEPQTAYRVESKLIFGFPAARMLTDPVYHHRRQSRVTKVSQFYMRKFLCKFSVDLYVS